MLGADAAPALVSVMLVNNETGVVQPVRGGGRNRSPSRGAGSLRCGAGSRKDFHRHRSAGCGHVDAVGAQDGRRFPDAARLSRGAVKRRARRSGAEARNAADGLDRRTCPGSPVSGLPPRLLRRCPMSRGLRDCATGWSDQSWTSRRARRPSPRARNAWGIRAAFRCRASPAKLRSWRWTWLVSPSARALRAHRER